MWFYRHSTEDSAKLELIEKCSKFVNGPHNIRILVWDGDSAFIKKIEILLERPNTKHAKYWLCDICTHIPALKSNSFHLVVPLEEHTSTEMLTLASSSKICLSQIG